MFNPYPSSRELSKMNAERIEELENENAQLHAENEQMAKTISEAADKIREIGKEATEYHAQLERYTTAQAEGRLHIAPCADGTEIFRYEQDDDDPFPYVITEKITMDTYIHGFTEFVYGDLGQGWFLTRAAAAAALAEKGMEK